MTHQCSTHDSAARGPSRAPSGHLHEAKRPEVRRSAKAGALLSLLGLAGSVLVAPTGASAASFGFRSFAPGSVVVAQGGTISGNGLGTPGTVSADGYVNVYPPNSNGDVAPEASFTQGMYGPFVVVFDPAGDMWAANVDNTSDSTIVEITAAQLATPNPVPAVTITGAGDALEYPYGMAFDGTGDLWVVGNYVGVVYEYAKWQLAHSGSPTPVRTITELPATPNGDGFDPWGNLWVSTATSTQCPQGCVVEFSKSELASPHPGPTVIISSTGGANLSFTPSGDMWLVTGGGPASDCVYGDPCNNELVEFTRAQLSASGSPAPAVTIRSDITGCSTYGAPATPCANGSLYGPYGVAVDPAGDVWVSNFNTPTAVEYGRDQLPRWGSASPTPERTIAGPDTGMDWPSFVTLAP
jgi:hypothetical protein